MEQDEMNEIEVRVLNIDVDKTREKLLNLDAKLVKNEIQTNYIYDFPGDALYKNYKGYCRIREARSLLDGTKKYILTIKKLKSQVEFKNMLEIETEISDLQAGRKILSELGLYNRATWGKKRESYELNGVLFEIDEWDKNVYPTPYMEVEASTKEMLVNSLHLLGYGLEDTTSKMLRELRADLGLKDE